MPSKEQYDLLFWLRDQPAPVSMRKMERLNAPGFTPQRVDNTRKAGLIVREIDVEDGMTVGVYSISDLGRAALSELEEKRDKAAKDDADKAAARRFQLLNTLLGAAIGSALTLLVEHFEAILEILRALVD